MSGNIIHRSHQSCGDITRCVGANMGDSWQLASTADLDAVQPLGLELFCAAGFGRAETAIGICLSSAESVGGSA